MGIKFKMQFDSPAAKSFTRKQEKMREHESCTLGAMKWVFSVLSFCLLVDSLLSVVACSNSPQHTFDLSFHPYGNWLDGSGVGQGFQFLFRSDVRWWVYRFLHFSCKLVLHICNHECYNVPIKIVFSLVFTPFSCCFISIFCRLVFLPFYLTLFLPLMVYASFFCFWSPPAIGFTLSCVIL